MGAEGNIALSCKQLIMEPRIELATCLFVLPTTFYWLIIAPQKPATQPPRPAPLESDLPKAKEGISKMILDSPAAMLKGPAPDYEMARRQLRRDVDELRLLAEATL